MKLAVCLSGNPRQFKSSYPSFKKHILDQYDCDVFLFTWDNKLNTPFDQFGSFRYQDEGTLDEYVDLYKPKSKLLQLYTFETEKFFVEKEKEYNFIRSDNYVRRYIAMLYGIRQANRLRQEYELANNLKYDYILRCRPDVEYSSFKLEECSLMIDHYGNGRFPNAPGDVFAYGKSEAMDIYSDLCRYVGDYFREGVEINTEVLLEYHLRKNKIDFGICRHVAEINRPK
jgi:hypothetical protein